jgi:hypothetical protein
MPTEDLVIVWRGESPADVRSGGHASATTQVFGRSDGGDWTETSQRHRQRHHPESTVRDAARCAGLEIAEVRGMRLDGSFSPQFDELECSKVVYVARADAQAHNPGTGTRGT